MTSKTEETVQNDTAMRELHNFTFLILERVDFPCFTHISNLNTELELLSY